MRDGKIINGLRLGAAAAILLAVVALQARSCKELCEKFGSYEACESLKVGVQECDSSSPATSSYQKSLLSSSIPSKQSTVFYTTWKPLKNSGRFLGHHYRYKIVTRPGYFLFSAEANPPLDPTGIVFDLSKESSYDGLGESTPMHCEEESRDQYRCSCPEKTFISGGKCSDRTIIYRENGGKGFDFLVYSGVTGKGEKQILLFRIYSDGKFLYDLSYKNGQINQKKSETWPIEKIE